MFEIRAYFEKVLKKLDIIDAKVSGVPQVQVQVNSRYLATLNALARLGGAASASQVAAVTGRSRAYESTVLNQLVRMGVLAAERVGKTKVFRVRADG
mgnify:CR=1 FL=1